ncbi:MAG: phage tail protein [Moraxella sp.]|nr:phage tail protein [Moraxella sp.]
MSNNTPIIFTITTAGKNAVLNAQNRGLKLTLNRLTLGTAKWTATKAATDLRSKRLDFTIVSAGVETQSNTLRFSVTMSSQTLFDAYEMGLYTDTGVLFAVATSTTKPLVRLHPEVAIVVGSFGLSLVDIDAQSITVNTDQNSLIAIQMMQNHNAATDPHPQYLKANEFDTAAADILKRLTALESKEIIPVGGLFITTNHYNTGDDVARALGYGRWERYAKGTTLVGQDPAATVKGQKAWWATMGNIVGEFAHKLTPAELPSDFGVPYFPDGFGHSVRNHGNHGTAYYAGGGGGKRTWKKPDDYPKAGDGSGLSDQPHNNIQPSVVVAVWVRLPDSGSITIPSLYQGTDASNISVGDIGSQVESQLLANADALNKQLQERLATAISQIAELEKRILGAGGKLGGVAAPEWQAFITTSISTESDPFKGDATYIAYNIVQFVQSIGYKNANLQQTGAVLTRKSDSPKVSLVFDSSEDIDVNAIIFKPRAPSNLSRNQQEKTLTWHITGDLPNLTLMIE